jgi:Phospholipase_D-nuclease N-terminal
MMNSTLTPDAVGIGAGIAFVLLIGGLILAGIALFALWLWMLVDCAQAPEPPGDSNHRLVWILILVFTGWIGALLYFFLVRRPRIAASRPVEPRGFPPLPPPRP